jgi:hypothetical protein
LWAAAARADQFTVVDVTYTHSAMNTKDSHYFVKPAAGSPANWRMPIDYASGTIYMHVEVFTKPSAERTVWNFCFIGTPSYACAGTPSYTKTGVYEWSQKFSSFYQYNQVDWTKRPSQVALILKDSNNVKPAPENVGATRSALFMPTTVRIVLTIVSPGGTYMRPGDAGAPPDAAPRTDGGAAADRPAASEGGVTGGNDAGATGGGGMSGAGGTGGGTGGSNGGPKPPTGGAGGAAGGAAGSGDEEPPPLGETHGSNRKTSGCAAAPGAPRGAPAAFLVLGLALMVRARRRR